MKIHNIQIENFKRFKNSSFSFDDRFTVLIGENATGKTSILEALAIAVGSFLLGIEGAVAKSIHESQIRIMLIDGQPKPQKPVVVKAEGSIDGIKLTWKRELINKNTTSRHCTKIIKIAHEKLLQSRSQSGVVFPLLAYYGTGRVWAEHEKINYQKQAEGVVMAYNNCLSVKSSSKEFISWFKTQEDYIKKFDQALDKAHFEAFKKTITTLIPDNRWSDIAFDYKSDQLMGIFTDEHGAKHKLSYNQLSDGFRNIVNLAAGIAYRCIQLNPHLGSDVVSQTPGVVLIDELDLHLHPNWQRHIVDNLKKIFPNLQFIATTHSPFIVQGLSKSELINLDSPDNSTRLEKAAYNYGIEDVAEIEMGVTDVARSDAFKERVEVASRYFQLIQKGANKENNQELADLQARLNELEERFSDDPTFVAYLRAERHLKKI